MTKQNETIPVDACYLEIPGDAALACGENGENAKSAPVQLLARTGDAIDHWYWGPIVHDLDGMSIARGRVLIDWRHDREEQLGYLNKFETSTGDLVARGALVPYKGDDRAAEIAYKSREGVPYQASIEFGGELVLEEVAEGQTVTVNQREMTGPLTVFREWELEAVAICPFGADPNTVTQALDGGDGRRVSIKKVQTMTADQTITTEATPEEATELAAVDTETTVTDTEASETTEAVDATETELAETSEPIAEHEQRADLVRQFCDEFGKAHGQRYFLEGLTLETARTQFTADLQRENDDLRGKLAALSDSEPEALQSAPVAVDGPRSFSQKIRIAGKQYNDR